MFLITLLILLMLGVLILGIPRLITGFYSNPRITSVSEAASERVAIVFGAGLRRDGTPTTILRDRVETAVALYRQGKVEKLLFSGDNSYIDYNEPGSMKEYAMSLGVPETDIVLDFAGRRTYDTCYRAQEIFGLEKALLVTQPYHLPQLFSPATCWGWKVRGFTRIIILTGKPPSAFGTSGNCRQPWLRFGSYSSQNLNRYWEIKNQYFINP